MKISCFGTRGKIDPDTMNREFGWYVYREVTVGKRTAKVGIRLWVHAHKIVGKNWTKVNYPQPKGCELVRLPLFPWGD